MLGTYTTREPDTAVIGTLARGKRWEEEQIGYQLELSGHDDWSSTECPGNVWPLWRQRILDDSDPVIQPGECPAIPEEYEVKFGPGATWPGVVANPEGIIGSLLEKNGELADQLAVCHQSDPERVPSVADDEWLADIERYRARPGVTVPVARRGCGSNASEGVLETP